MERFVMLNTIDKLWIDHLDAIDDLRDGIGLRAHAQRDPLIEYKGEAFNSFQKLMDSIDYEITRKIFRVQITQRPPQAQPLEGEEVKPEEPQPQATKKIEKQPSEPARTDLAGEKSDFSKAFASAGQNTTAPSRINPEGATSEKREKIGRNDPCWCGSKKKWKKCHYPNKG